MSTDEQTIWDFIKTLRKRTRPAAIAAFAVLLAMTCFVFLLPTVYESRASLLIEQLDPAVELAGGEGLREYAEQRLQRTRQLVMTDDNIRTLLQKHGLYDAELPLAQQISAFTSAVFITPRVTGVIDPRTMRSAELTYAFDVGFWHSNPELATALANDLAQLFVDSSKTRARADAQRAIQFASTESERLAEELRVREARLAKFREQNPGGLPEDRVRNQDRVMGLERELAGVDADLRAARARRDLIDAQLRDTPRDAPVIDETGQVVRRGADRLAVAQQELVAALAKYSEDHPDVRRLRREIATLSTEMSGGSQSAPTNPAYIQLQSQSNAAAVEIRELAARRAAISSQLSQLQGAVTLSPRLEEQYRELIRDYQIIQTQYEQLRGQQASAELRSKAAGTPATETYVLINPARVPEDPVEPDRVALMFLAVVLAIAAGIGTAFVLNAADTTVRGSLDVAALSGAQPFAHIPEMRDPLEQRRQRLFDFALAGGLAVATVVVLVIVN